MTLKGGASPSEDSSSLLGIRHFMTAIKQCYPQMVIGPQSLRAANVVKVSNTMEVTVWLVEPLWGLQAQKT